MIGFVNEQQLILWDICFIKICGIYAMLIGVCKEILYDIYDIIY